MKVGDEVAIKGRIGAGKRGKIVQQGPAKIPWEGGHIRVGRDHFKVQFDRGAHWYPAKNLEHIMDAKTKREIIATLKKHGRADLAKTFEVTALGPAWGISPKKILSMPIEQQVKHLSQSVAASGAGAMLEAMVGKAASGWRGMHSHFHGAIDQRKLEKAIALMISELEKAGALV